MSLLFSKNKVDLIYVWIIVMSVLGGWGIIIREICSRTIKIVENILLDRIIKCISFSITFVPIILYEINLYLPIYMLIKSYFHRVMLNQGVPVLPKAEVHDVIHENDFINDDEEEIIYDGNEKIDDENEIIDVQIEDDDDENPRQKRKFLEQ